MKTLQKQSFVLLLTLFSVFYFSGITAQTVSKSEVEQQMLKKADENIEKFKKGNAEIQFKDKDGKPQWGKDEFNA